LCAQSKVPAVVDLWHDLCVCRRKMKEDANWRRPQIILSGAEMPGEGEHKIMEYIRRVKSQPVMSLPLQIWL
jgi:5'-3' exonuclease